MLIHTTIEETINSSRSVNDAAALTNRSNINSARSEKPIDSARSTLNTARAETALAALAAERSALENRLAIIEAALEQEDKKNSQKPRLGKSKSSSKQHL